MLTRIYDFTVHSYMPNIIHHANTSTSNVGTLNPLTATKPLYISPPSVTDH